MKELIILMLFGALGIWQLQSDWRTGVVALTLAGFGAIILGIDWLRTRRPRVLVNQVQYGVELYEKRSHALITALALIALGSIMCWLGTRYPLLFRSFGALLAAGGLWVLARIARGFHRSTFLRFEREALWIGRESYQLEIPWNNIRDFGPLGYTDDPAVIMRIAEPARIVVRPQSRRSRSDQEELPATVFVRPHAYGVDGKAFTAALLRHVPDVRTHRPG